MTLDREDVEAVALRVVELLEDRGHVHASAASPLVTAQVVAKRLGKSVDFVYRHGDELGVRRVGGGPRPRLLFDLAELDRRLDSCSGSRESEALQPARVQGIARRRRRSSGSGVDLLPVRRVDRG